MFRIIVSMKPTYRNKWFEMLEDVGIIYQVGSEENKPLKSQKPKEWNGRQKNI